VLTDTEPRVKKLIKCCV